MATLRPSLAVARFVHFAHAARAQQGNHLVASPSAARAANGRRRSPRTFAATSSAGFSRNAIGVLLLRQQRFHFAAQLVIARASLVQKRSALAPPRAPARRDRAARLVASAQASFFARRSLHRLPLLCPISRASQALASLQSRRTVSGETFSTSAVSSTLKPPKKRNSTTRLFRGSTRARALQRIVQRDQVVAFFSCGPINASSSVTLGIAASALLVTARTRRIHQNPPHQLRADGEEMGAVLPVHLLAAQQFQVGLVDQCRGLQGVAGALPEHVAPREAPQFLVDQGDELLQGRRLRPDPKPGAAGSLAEARVSASPPPFGVSPPRTVANVTRPF